MGKKLTKKECFERFKQIHKDKYTYDDFEYKNINQKIKINCPKHGVFEQTIASHILQNQGCPKCGIESAHDKTKINFEKFLAKANEIHNNKYRYEKPLGTFSIQKKVKIFCKEKDSYGIEHGYFEQKAFSHLRGHGCPKCGGVTKYNKELFVKRSNILHNNKYDYSKVEYVNNNTNVCITCPKHGDFWQTPHMHLQGHNCPKCANENSRMKRSKSAEKFIEDAIKIHGSKYNYSKVQYVNTETKVCIACPKHGEFFQTPHMHLSGNGCPKCKQSRMEYIINDILKLTNIKYKYNSKPNFLNGLEADFLLEKEKIVIECQGTQHLLENHFFEPLEVVIERDERKLKQCNENGYKMIYVLPKKYYSKCCIDKRFNHTYDDALLIEDIIKDNNILLDKIKQKSETD